MNAMILETLTVAAIYGLVTLSLNLQYGLTGLINFGQSFLFAVGGYTIGVVYFHGFPVWTGLVAAPIVGAIAGLILAVPTKRLNDHYWALMTLGVAELFIAIVTNERWIAGGDLGTYGIPRVPPHTLLPILAVVILVVVLVFERIRRSQFGRLMRVAREDHALVAALGRSVFRIQTLVLMLGGMVAAIGGVALAYWLTVVAPEVFVLDQTVIVWAMMIIGGRGNMIGALIGAVVLQTIFVGSRFLPDFGGLLSGQDYALMRTVLVGLILVLVVMFRIDGLFPERRVIHAPER